MAKLSLINRDEKRAQLVKKYAKKREALHRDHRQPEGVGRGRATRRGSSCSSCRATRTRRACATAARSPAVRAAYFRKFGLGRNKLREYAMRGEIPGIVKAAGSRQRGDSTNEHD